MRFGSVCSGIEAASVAWNPLGWRAEFFSEIEPFPCAVLAHHYPETPNHGDMTKFAEWPDHAIDLLCGGTPCQSFSVAGLRKGLDDPRGNLMLTFGAIAARYRPRWLVWENVPGVLSSNGGRDFGSFLGLLGHLGYGFAYRVLDAQYAGLAQRRKRVFVVGCLGDWRRAAAVLFERHSLSGHPAPSREAREGVADRTARSVAIRGRDGTPQAELGEDIANAILTPNGGRAGVGVGAVLTPDVGMCLNAKGGAGRLDAESETLIPTIGGVFDVAHALTGEGFDASEDGTGRGTPLVPVGVTLHGTDGTARVASYDELAQCLRARAPGHIDNSSTTIVQQPMAHAFDARQADVIQYGDKTGPLDTDGSTIGVLAFDTYNQSLTGDTAQTLCSRGDSPGGSAHLVPAVQRGMSVRRLTPRECARLQGFPDDYLDITFRGKPAADGNKYRALGNSWAVPVVSWIGRRIMAVEEIASGRGESVGAACAVDGVRDGDREAALSDCIA